MTILKTTTKQSHWDLSTKMKFDQKICLHENTFYDINKT